MFLRSAKLKRIWLCVRLTETSCLGLNCGIHGSFHLFLILETTKKVDTILKVAIVVVFINRNVLNLAEK